MVEVHCNLCTQSGLNSEFIPSECSMCASQGFTDLPQPALVVQMHVAQIMIVRERCGGTEKRMECDAMGKITTAAWLAHERQDKCTYDTYPLVYVGGGGTQGCERRC